MAGDIFERIERYATALILVPIVIANSGVSMAELKAEAKRRGKLKEMEDFERRIWFDVGIGFVLLIIVLLLVK
jgi:hypothetical protein